MRGKDYSYPEQRLLLLGSPPLARERRDFRAASHADKGITPACAGKTILSSFESMHWQDHPRLRGKDSWSAVRQKYAWGSPPLARERRFLIFLVLYLPGITPACAGKTYLANDFIVTHKDHPRLRGKDGIMSACQSLVIGSPPLARERLSENKIPLSASGITPACAGKTDSENISDDYGWITPACAGKTFMSDKGIHLEEDHPRLRGKDRLWHSAQSSCTGSPPLARERRQQRLKLYVCVRITPACAGKTSRH